MRERVGICKRGIDNWGLVTVMGPPNFDSDDLLKSSGYGNIIVEAPLWVSIGHLFLNVHLEAKHRVFIIHKLSGRQNYSREKKIDKNYDF